MRRTTQAERTGAAVRAMERRKANEAAGLKSPPARDGARSEASGSSGFRGAAAALSRMALAQAGNADYYGVANYANSKLPTAHCAGPGSDPNQTCQKDSDCTGYQLPYMIGADQYPGGATCTGPVVPGTGIRKFVDTLPTLCALQPPSAANLNRCLPLAVPDTTTFPGSDYYEIGIKDFTSRFHSDLPNPARERGYYQKNTTDTYASQAYFLGPIILATTNRPVRFKLVNELPTGPAGNLFIPMDETLSGVGTGPLGGTEKYTQNRIATHLHGGNTPWISDGTQHQWIAPVGETTSYKKGPSVAYVPDMWFDASGNVIPASVCPGSQACSIPGASHDPGDGAISHYYTNQQSGRFMFYHDHAYGITRLNVAVGVAAGYLLVNPVDEDALAAATVPGTIGTTPDLEHMIPLVIQDRTFVPPADQLAWQDPTWDPVKWGGEDQMWYPHVYTPNQWPGNPDNSNTNPFGRWDYGPWFWPPLTSLTTRDGQPRPLTVPCTSASAVTAANPTGATDCPSTPNPSLVPEAFLDTPIVNGTAYPTITVDPVAYRFQILNAAGERNFNLSWFLADTSGTEVGLVPAEPHFTTSALPLCATNATVNPVTGLPDACWPRIWPADSRQGGVPAPAAAGPKWIQIGTEAGLLPATAVIPPTPVGYEQNKRNIVVLNVSTKGLFIGPAERADLVVDFSAFAGKTLILYNDAPAPVPAGDPRQDYYTGGPDFTTSGGAPTPLPGYGPNTRTIMQVKVRGTASAPNLVPFDEAKVTPALNARFVASQPPPIVPEAYYNQLYSPPTPYVDTLLPINATALTFTPVLGNAPVTLPMQPKAIQELFDLDYGRMNSLLGSEIPTTNFRNQTTIPFANYDPTTDFLTDNEPQIWKITHNGVDTHTIHFHLLNVQVINRVGWDGQIRGPDANEMGWKESVRMHPLEDIYVAALPVKQSLPFPVPDKFRYLDVDAPPNTSTQFTGLDIYNQPIAVTNTIQNFGWEYVWHCHLLGHEEGDMLRSEVFVVAPEAPTGLTVNGTGPRVLNWTDASVSAQTFVVQRDTNALFTTPGNTIGTVAAGTTTYSDATVPPPEPYFYRVGAQKVLTSPAVPGSTFPATSWSQVAQVGSAPSGSVLPAALDFGVRASPVLPVSQTVTLTNGGAARLNLTGISFTGANAADFAQVNTCGTGVNAGGSCTITVTFNPATAGIKAAAMTIASNDPFHPTLSVPLSGSVTLPATGVTLTPSLPSPQPVGAVVTFTAQGVGGAGQYQYQFWVLSYATWTLVQPYSSKNTWTLSSRTPAQSLQVVVEVRTNVNANADQMAALSYQYGNGPATGLTVTPSVPSPAPYGTPVTFTAQGTGSLGGYQYQFWLYSYGSWTIVQPYSPANSWTLPGSTFPGSYQVVVEVRTNAGVAQDLKVTLDYQVGNSPATGVTLSAPASLPSPQPLGTAVTFTAQGVGGSGTYQYQFWLLAYGTWTIVQAYSPVNTWTLPNWANLGQYQVVVQVRTNSTVIQDQQASMTYQIGNSAATGVTLTPSAPSPQAQNALVTFTASGIGGSGTYQYQFWMLAYATWTIVQPYGTSNTWTMPTGVPGSYEVVVEVRTNPTVSADAKATTVYVIQ